MTDVLKFRERLADAPSKIMTELVFEPELKRDLKNLNNLIWINVAHTIMLVEAKLIKLDEGKVLLDGLLGVNVSEIASECTAELEDIYFCLEHHLAFKFGLNVCGNMHLGRSRNEIYATLMRMDCRNALLETLINGLLSLAEVCIEQAKHYVNTVMPGYTHMQQAQPITLGHYLMALGEVIDNILQAIMSVHTRTNMSPMGACAFAGTHIPINRERTADLLGFDGVINNTIAAVGDRGFMFEYGAECAEIATLGSRVAIDLQIWGMNELGFIQMDDSMCICSSVMPQKRNPVCLEFIRGKAASVHGLICALLACFKNIPFTWIGDTSSEPSRIMDDLTTKSYELITILTESLRNMRIDASRMNAALDLGFINTTEFAESLVKSDKLTFREAHSWVATLVADLDREATPFKKMPIGILKARFRNSFERELSQESIDIVTGSEIVLQKPTRGGPGREEMSRSIERLENILTTRRSWLQNKRGGLEKSIQRTWETAKEISNS